MEAPSVEAVQKKVAGEVSVYGVAWTGDESSYKGFIERHGLTFRQIDDSGADVFSRYGIASQPAWVFVTRSGKATVSTGALGPEDLERALRALGDS
ncbi:MAG: hypothetical protein FJW53_01695 [Actinobacteria bacterium]|nr:hypothetical protein [Actinomycetota bacterium]